MYMIYVIAFFLAIITGDQVVEIRARQQAFAAAQAEDTARNFGIYANYAAKAYTAAPGFTGVFPTAALGLPAWYRPLTGLTALVSGSHLYVYQPQSDAAAAGRALRLIAAKGAVVGMNISGTIYSPGNVAIMAAPAGMPNLAVVQIVV